MRLLKLSGELEDLPGEVSCSKLKLVSFVEFTKNLWLIVFNVSHGSISNTTTAAGSDSPFEKPY